MSKRILLITLIGILFVLVCFTQFNNLPKEISIDRIEYPYIENNNKENEDDKVSDVILSYQDIIKYNEIIASKTSEIYDLNDYISISQEDILAYINKYQLPSNISISASDKNTILNNRNLNNITGHIEKGIIVKRANLRSFPTNQNFYEKGSNSDMLQETELLVNTGVLVIHESTDQKWYFVISPLYMGWVLKENIVFVHNDEFDFFIKPSKFGIITDKVYSILNTNLDMSVKLPYKDNDTYYLPTKDDLGNLQIKEIDIDNSHIHLGYLPYTKDNVFNQAFKYEGTTYSWGGYNEGVDCSSFIANIYRTFGFVFPRNTSSQNKSVGEIINLKGLDNTEKLNLINNTEPSLLYQDGHVMLYIGVNNNYHEIIHASGKSKVMVSILEKSSYLNNINKLVLVK